MASWADLAGKGTTADCACARWVFVQLPGLLQLLGWALEGWLRNICSGTNETLDNELDVSGRRYKGLLLRGLLVEDALSVTQEVVAWTLAQGSRALESRSSKCGLGRAGGGCLRAESPARAPTRARKIKCWDQKASVAPGGTQLTPPSSGGHTSTVKLRVSFHMTGEVPPPSIGHYVVLQEAVVQGYQQAEAPNANALLRLQ